MEVEKFVEALNADFYTGVPDSLLKPLCDYLIDVYGTDPSRHIIGANEGNCAAVAAGYYLSTGKVPVVYMQNSGQGNMINPAASLLNPRVYAIPAMFVVGWRGEPGVRDEPQHVYQGEITLKLLEDMEIENVIVDKDTGEDDLRAAVSRFCQVLSLGRSVAFVIRKGAFTYKKNALYQNRYLMRREDIIRHIVAVSGEDPVISTTGKASRELFEIREQNGQSHQYDFLTVGSMGHSSSIALGVAVSRPNARVWCVDGDGAALMHMGSMAVIGAAAPSNLIHIVINNEAHETVGGMPTAARTIDLVSVAKSCGYAYAAGADEFAQLDHELKKARDSGKLCFLEVKCAIGARDDLGRPTIPTVENKASFMRYLQTL